MHDLISSIAILPLTPSSQADTSSGPTLSTSFVAIKATLEPLLLADWNASGHPLPALYLYDACLSPQAFTGRPCFISGRIHQMRSGASYMAAHLSWRNCLQSTLCPLCEEDDESFQHAILHYPAKSLHRLTNLSGVDNIGPDAPLSSSVPLVRGVANYLYASCTGFPPAMIACHAAVSSPSSGSEVSS